MAKDKNQRMLFVFVMNFISSILKTLFVDFFPNDVHYTSFELRFPHIHFITISRHRGTGMKLHLQEKLP